MHAEVRIDDSVVMIGGGATDVQAAVHIHVYVADVHSTFERAIAAGGEVVQQPERKRADDDMRCGVRDASGTTWWIASQ